MIIFFSRTISPMRYFCIPLKSCFSPVFWSLILVFFVFAFEFLFFRFSKLLGHAIPQKRAMLLLIRRGILIKVTCCLLLALGIFLRWRISHDIQSTFSFSYRVLEYEKLQELAIFMPPASSPASLLSTQQSNEKLLQHRTTLITTTSCGQPYFLLVLVSSAPFNVPRRRDIRLTWGIDSVLNPRRKTFFLVAQTRNQTESDALLKEDERSRDLIRADYYEH